MVKSSFLLHYFAVFINDYVIIILQKLLTTFFGSREWFRMESEQKEIDEDKNSVAERVDILKRL